MKPTQIAETSSHAELLEAGALAARERVPRSKNPLNVGSEAWMSWMDGYDHQVTWTMLGRGDFCPNWTHE